MASLSGQCQEKGRYLGTSLGLSHVATKRGVLLFKGSNGAVLLGQNFQAITLMRLLLYMLIV